MPPILGLRSEDSKMPCFENMDADRNPNDAKSIKTMSPRRTGAILAVLAAAAALGGAPTPVESFSAPGASHPFESNDGRGDDRPSHRDLLRPHGALPDHIVRCVVLSDTHGRHDRLPPLPDGDVLLHLGDAADKGSLSHIRSFAEYLKHRAPNYHKDNTIFVQGNHDFDRKDPNLIDLRCELQDVATVLLDETATIKIPGKPSLRLFGASWETCRTDAFDRGSAVDIALETETLKARLAELEGLFTVTLPASLAAAHRSKTALRAHSETIVDDGNDTLAPPVDFFLSHNTPLIRRADNRNWHQGSDKMGNLVDRHDIPVHLCGHVHHGRGVQMHDNKRSVCINCATSRRNRPVVVDYDAVRRRVVNVEL